jgi:hypothetical protein
VNGKQYIGRDKNNNPNYLGSGVLIKSAIKKYGRENFKKEILQECFSFEELIQCEEYWLNYYDAGNNINFYNVHNFSRGPIQSIAKKEVSVETRRKISDALKGKFHSEDHKRKIAESISKSKLGIKRKPFSEEHKRKLSESISKSKSGIKRKPFSEEHKRRIGESVKKSKTNNIQI